MVKYGSHGLEARSSSHTGPTSIFEGMSLDKYTAEPDPSTGEIPEKYENESYCYYPFPKQALVFMCL